MAFWLRFWVLDYSYSSLFCYITSFLISMLIFVAVLMLMAMAQRRQLTCQLETLTFIVSSDLVQSIAFTLHDVHGLRP
jgi:hypothetical protein